MDILIRPLEKGDIDTCLRIENENFSMPWSGESFEAACDLDYCHYLVAVCDGEVVSLAGYRESYGEADIDNVFTDRKYQGRGIATRVLQKLIDEGTATGITAFTLEVRVSNEPAIHVYEKLGFKSVGIRPRFYEKPVEDANIMWLYISQ
ncbi:MAG: ribosomal protein S18-alanine N-acetyltransferase [Acetatifactor sp.]|nr:ribosomal protein S18-alanine N-acetyltransferase [Acetatifactor sp.]